MAHKNKRQQDMIIKRIQHSMSEFVDIVELDCALWKDPVGPLLNPEEAGGHTVELSTKFKLGGMIVLRGASEAHQRRVGETHPGLWWAWTHHRLLEHPYLKTEVRHPIDLPDTPLALRLESVSHQGSLWDGIPCC